jgi:hypothetical protein
MRPAVILTANSPTSGFEFFKCKPEITGWKFCTPTTVVAPPNKSIVIFIEGH